MHGGKRENAGRKNGSTTKKRGAIQVQAVAEGIKPAEVMQRAMEWHFEAGRYDEAAAIAKDLAPYVHPRKSTTPDRPAIRGARIIFEFVAPATDGAPPGDGPGRQPALPLA